eukprot:363789-Chlamydomonas_euryale.AAC.5
MLSVTRTPSMSHSRPLGGGGGGGAPARSAPGLLPRRPPGLPPAAPLRTLGRGRCPVPCRSRATEPGKDPGCPPEVPAAALRQRIASAAGARARTCSSPARLVRCGVGSGGVAATPAAAREQVMANAAPDAKGSHASPRSQVWQNKPAPPLASAVRGRGGIGGGREEEEEALRRLRARERDGHEACQRAERLICTRGLSVHQPQLLPEKMF